MADENKDFYKEEARRLQEKLQSTDVASPEYDKIIEQLSKVQQYEEKEKEIKRKLPKEDRQIVGAIITKIVGFVGLGLLAFGLAKFEKDGNIFSGSSKESINGIIKIGSKLFH